MALEKETTGLYLSGHPMDDYRPYLKNTRVVTIGSLMSEDAGLQDDTIVSVAGIIQKVKMKTTRNQSMMAYVTLEDDTAAIEMLAFSNVLNQYGSYIKEGSAVVITGRLSIRDEKEPQIVVNRAVSIEAYTEAGERETRQPEAQVRGKLYLRLPTENCREYGKTKAILNMFPGSDPVLLYFADTKVRRGTMCTPEPVMLEELRRLLGQENVVMQTPK